jgi:bifunctional DNase/RNase
MEEFNNKKHYLNFNFAFSVISSLDVNFAFSSITSIHDNTYYIKIIVKII